MTAADIPVVWKNIEPLRTIFFQPSEKDAEYFASMMLARTTVAFIVRDGALIFFTDFQVGHNAFFNGVVWDETLYRRQDLALQIIDIVFETLNLRRLTVSAPADNVLARRYAESLGFVEEGQLEGIIPRGEHGVDLFYMGLMRRNFYNDRAGNDSRIDRGRSIPGERTPERREESENVLGERARENGQDGSESSERGHHGSRSPNDSRDTGISRPVGRWRRAVRSALSSWQPW
jgi:hypothetical protein